MGPVVPIKEPRPIGLMAAVLRDAVFGRNSFGHPALRDGVLRERLRPEKVRPAERDVHKDVRAAHPLFRVRFPSGLRSTDDHGA